MEENYSNNLKSGIILIFMANLINLAISLLNGFILPKFLSVETYADIKTYQLYANYIGVLALGYSDGIYLKYGGKSISSISDHEINYCRTNMIIFQGIMSIAFASIACVITDKMLLLAAITLVPVNIASAYKNIMQATGEFRSYSSIMNYTSVLTFIGTMILLFVVGIDEAIYYVSFMAIVTFIVWILLERKLYVQYTFPFKLEASISNLVENIKSGFVLMLGNFSSILMTSIDRWFVKGLLTTADFAYYSFVVSTENLVAVFINPVVTTMYNYICVNSDYSKLRKIKRMCMIFGLFLVSGAFVIKFVLEIYLTKYILSEYILFILFATEILFIVIKGIYVNIYKARKRQDIYLKQLVAAIIIGCILNSLFYFIFRSNEGIAFATLLSVICWYIICSFSVREIRPNLKEILVLTLGICSFIIFGFFMPPIIGFLLYISFILLLCLLFMKNDLITLLSMALDVIKQRLNKI